MAKDSTEKFYNLLVKNGDYTKSFDEFKTQFSNEGSRAKLYNYSRNRGYYTKTKDEFDKQFFGYALTANKSVEGAEQMNDRNNAVAQGQSANAGSPYNQQPIGNASGKPLWKMAQENDNKLPKVEWSPSMGVIGTQEEADEAAQGKVKVSTGDTHFLTPDEEEVIRDRVISELLPTNPSLTQLEQIVDWEIKKENAKRKKKMDSERVVEVTKTYDNNTAEGRRKNLLVNAFSNRMNAAGARKAPVDVEMDAVTLYLNTPNGQSLIEDLANSKIDEKQFYEQLQAGTMRDMGSFINANMQVIGERAAESSVAEVKNSINKALNQDIKKTAEKFGGGRWPSLYAPQYGAAMPDPSMERGDQALLSALKLTDDAEKMISGAKSNGFWEALGKGLLHETTNLENWIAFSGIQNNAEIMKVLDKYDKKGEESLSEHEKLLMDAIVTNAATTMFYKDKLSGAYKAGAATGASIPFMIEFAILPYSNLEKGIGKTISKWASKMASKRAGRLAINELSRAASSAIFSVTADMPKIVSGAIERMTGEAKVSINGETGELEYKGREGQQTALEAVGNSAAEVFAGNFTERALDPLLGMARGKISKILRNGNYSIGGFGRVISEVFDNPLMRGAQFEGILGEYSEELLNNAMTAAFCSDQNFSDNFSQKQLTETLQGLLPTQFFFSLIGLGRGMSLNCSARKYARAEQKELLNYFSNFGEMPDGLKDNDKIKAATSEASSRLARAIARYQSGNEGYDKEDFDKEVEDIRTEYDLAMADAMAEAADARTAELRQQVRDARNEAKDETIFKTKSDGIKAEIEKVQSFKDAVATYKSGKVIGEQVKSELQEEYGIDRNEMKSILRKQTKDMDEREREISDKYLEQVAIRTHVEAEERRRTNEINGKVSEDGKITNIEVDGKKGTLVSGKDGLTIWRDEEGNLGQCTDDLVKVVSVEEPQEVIANMEKEVEDKVAVSVKHSPGSIVKYGERFYLVGNITDEGVELIDYSDEKEPSSITVSASEMAQVPTFRIKKNSITNGVTVVDFDADTNNYILSDGTHVESELILKGALSRKERLDDLPINEALEKEETEAREKQQAQSNAIDDIVNTARERARENNELLDTNDDGTAYIDSMIKQTQKKRSESEKEYEKAKEEFPSITDAAKRAQAKAKIITLKERMADLDNTIAQYEQARERIVGTEQQETTTEQPQMETDDNRIRSDIEKKYGLNEGELAEVEGMAEEDRQEHQQAALDEYNATVNGTQEQPQETETAGETEALQDETPKTREELNDMMKVSLSNMARRLGVNVVFSTERKSVKDDKGGSGKVEGQFNKDTNTIVIYLNNIDSVKRGAMVFAHEVIGHYGLRKLFEGKDTEMKMVLGAVYKGMSAGDIAKFSLISSFNPSWSTMSSEERIYLIADEYIASVTEEYQERKMNGTLDSKFMTKVNNVIDAFLRMLEKIFGYGKFTMTRDDVMYLITASETILMRESDKRYMIRKENTKLREDLVDALEQDLESGSVGEINPNRADDIVSLAKRIKSVLDKIGEDFVWQEEPVMKGLLDMINKVKEGLSLSKDFAVRSFMEFEDAVPKLQEAVEAKKAALEKLKGETGGYGVLSIDKARNDQKKTKKAEAELAKAEAELADILRQYNMFLNAYAVVLGGEQLQTSEKLAEDIKKEIMSLPEKSKEVRQDKTAYEQMVEIDKKRRSIEENVIKILKSKKKGTAARRIAKLNDKINRLKFEIGEETDEEKKALLNGELYFARFELDLLNNMTNEQVEQAAEEERLRNEDNAEEEARKKAEKEVMSTFNSVWGDRYDNNFQNEARGILKKYAHVQGVVDALADPQAKNEQTEDEVAAGVLGGIRISMGNTNAQGEVDKGGINTGVISNTSGNASDWKDLTRFGKFFTNEPVGKEKGIVSWGKACDLVEQACRDENVEVRMDGDEALRTMLSQAAQFGEAQGQTAAAGISNYILAKRIEQAREAARQWDSDNEQYREQNTRYSVKQDEYDFFNDNRSGKEYESVEPLDSKREYDINKVVELYNKYSTDKEQKELAKRVFDVASKLGFRVMFNQTDLGFGVGGRQDGDVIKYSRITTLEINKDKMPNVLLHEIIHGITVYCIDAYKNGELKNQKLVEAVEEINDVYDKIKDNSELRGEYGLKNEKELIAEMANPTFRNKLKKIGLWERLKNAIKKLFFFDNEQDVTANRVLSDALDKMLDNYDTELFEKYNRTRSINEDDWNFYEESNLSVGQNEEAAELSDKDVRFSIRTEPAPKKTGIGYKVFFRGKDGKLYPPMVANPNGEDTPVGVWLNADEGKRVEDSKTGRPQVKQGGKGTQGGSGKLAYRPGWHLGKIPYALQFNRKDENGERTLFPKDFVWAEVEYAMDNNYQEEAMQEGVNANGKFQHSLAGLKRVPVDGYYEYRTNPNPQTDPWIITGAMKVNRILTKDEVDDLVCKAGREPQKVEGNDSGVRFSITPEQDAEYMRAVESGDTEKAGQMVKAAFKAKYPNTKVVDENGEPLVVYHGDVAKNRYVFSANTFFGETEDYAKRYTNGTGDVSAVCLNIEKPFDIRDEKAKTIFTEYRNGHAPSITNSGAMDWAEFDYDDLQEYLEENHANQYDGFVIDEGGDGGYNSDVVTRGLSYVPFYPNQIKSADPITYDNEGNVIPLSERFNDNSDDIRYSVAPSDYEETNVIREAMQPTEQDEREYKLYSVAYDAISAQTTLDKVLASEPKYRENGYEDETMTEYFARFAEWRKDKEELTKASDEVKAEYEKLFKARMPILPKYDNSMSVMEYYREFAKAREAMQEFELVNDFNNALAETHKGMHNFLRFMYEHNYDLEDWQKRVAKALGQKSLETKYDILNAIMRSAPIISGRINEYGQKQGRELHDAVARISRYAEEEMGEAVKQAVRGSVRKKKVRRPENVTFNREDGSVWQPNWEWRNVDNESTPEGNRRNGQLLSPSDIIELYLQALDALEAQELGLPNRGLEGFVNQIGVREDEEPMSAERVVREFEENIGRDKCEGLQQAVRNATQFTMDELLRGGLISQDKYKETMMYDETTKEYKRKHYVPQRGWAFEAYLDETMFADAMKQAKGRTTLASTPLSYIQIIANSAITSAERNLARQALYRLATDKRRELSQEGNALQMVRMYEFVGKDRYGNDVVYETPTRLPDDAKERLVEIYQTEIKPLSMQVGTIKARITNEAKKGLLADKAKIAEWNEQIAELSSQIKEIKDKYGYIDVNSRVEYDNQKRYDPDMDSTVSVFVNGQRYDIHVNQKSVARNINGYYSSEIMDETIRAWRTVMQNPKIGKWSMSEVVKFMSAMRTQFSPVFAVRNFLRDAQFAFAMNMVEHNPEFAAKAMKNTFASKKLIWSFIKNDNSTEVRRAEVMAEIEEAKDKGDRDKVAKLMERLRIIDMFDEFAKGGAITGYSFAQDIPQLKEILEDAIGKAERRIAREEAKGKRENGDIAFAQYVFENIKNTSFGDIKDKTRKLGELASQVSELMTRFGQYRTVREEQMARGIDDIPAAINEAKEITVNFNRSGELAPFLGSLWYFANATLQGGYRILRAAVKHPAKLTLSYALYVALGAFMASISPDDPDDERYIPDYVWRTDIVIDRVRLPLPHFFRTGYYLGANIVWAMRGRKTYGEAMLDGLSNIIDDNLPAPMQVLSAIEINKAARAQDSFGVDWDKTWKKCVRGLFPSLMQPFSDNWLNMSFTGAKIYKEPFDKSISYNDTQMYYKNTNEFAVKLCEALQLLTGGESNNLYDVGGITLNPAKLSHTIEGLAGGAPTEYKKLVCSVIDWTKYGVGRLVGDGDGEEMPEVNRTFFIGSFYQPYQQDRFEDAYYWDIKSITDQYKRFYKELEENRGKSEKDEKLFRKWRESPNTKLYEEICGSIETKRGRHKKKATPLGEIKEKLDKQEPLTNKEIKSLIDWNRRWNEISQE